MQHVSDVDKCGKASQNEENEGWRSPRRSHRSRVSRRFSRRRRSRNVQTVRTISDLVRKRERDAERMARATTNVETNAETASNMKMQLGELLRLAGRLTSDQYKGWVYVIPTVRIVENLRYCKIGFSRDPDQRFKSLCTNNPHALDLAAVRAFRGNIGLETALKVLTAAYTTDAANEWRSLPPNMYNLIANLLPLYPWPPSHSHPQSISAMPTGGGKRRAPYHGGPMQGSNTRSDGWQRKRARKSQDLASSSNSGRCLRSSGTAVFGGFRVPELSAPYAPTIVPFASHLLDTIFATGLSGQSWKDADDIEEISYLRLHEKFLEWLNHGNESKSNGLRASMNALVFRFVDVLGESVAKKKPDRSTLLISPSALRKILPTLIPIAIQ